MVYRVISKALERLSIGFRDEETASEQNNC